MMEHPPISVLDVAEQVVAQVRLSDRLSGALDNYAPGDPYASNVRVRWLSRRRGYEVVLYLDADTLTGGAKR